MWIRLSWLLHERTWLASNKQSFRDRLKNCHAVPPLLFPWCFTSAKMLEIWTNGNARRIAPHQSLGTRQYGQIPSENQTPDQI
jgi:hypothetical protein